MRDTHIWSLSQEDPLEEGMATHSSILAWRIPWTEEPGGLQSTWSQRVGHDWATNTLISLVLISVRINIRHYSSSLLLACPRLHHTEPPRDSGPRQVGPVLVRLNCRGRQPPHHPVPAPCPLAFPREEVVLRFVSASQEGRGEWEDENEGHNQPRCLGEHSHFLFEPHGRL